MDLSDEPCYCDHGCLDMGDCCSDFKEFCGVLDCEVSDWSSWSPCSSSCGAGTSNRHRTVTRQEINGGASCPDLHQAKACREDGGCARQKGGHSKHDSAALRESAMLLPGKYSQLGTDKYDVRQNLKTFKEEDNDDQYCVLGGTVGVQFFLNVKKSTYLNWGVAFSFFFSSYDLGRFSPHEKIVFLNFNKFFVLKTDDK